MQYTILVVQASAAIPIGSFEVGHIDVPLVIVFVLRRPQDKPTEETLKRLEGVTVLKTDERGTITAVLESDRLSLEAPK